MVSGIGNALPSIQTMFAKTDTDANGSLTLEEFKAGAPDKSQAPVGAPPIEEVFAEADIDGDGSLTEAEMTTMMENRPKGPPPPRPQMSDDTISTLLELLQSSDETETTSASIETDTSTNALLTELLETLSSISGEEDSSSGSLFDYTS